MKKRNQKIILTAICLLTAFILWTTAISFIDTKAIGPQNSTVGFATVNSFIHNLTGVHLSLYTITDWLGLVPLCFVMGFGILGLVQLIKRKSLLKVDYNILVLGGFYIVVMASFILFEIFPINYRPVLIEGILEASYPSSTTLLVMCVMLTAIMQFNTRIKNKALRNTITVLISAFILFMVTARLVSGVHWFTDIIGGALLSSGLAMLYYFISNINIKK
ncbi:MAG: phosphatase PAP2 family protein [Ruminococcus sp.]|nr:phosphatase PAP2 family protein [Ruminococcus sp.]